MDTEKLPVAWRRPEAFLILLSIAMPLAFFSWMAMINNFSVEMAGFTGVEIGFTQSIREIPGFMAFAVVFVLLVMREQRLALTALLLLGLGVGATGFFPSFLGICVTTFVMSVGFHYFETVRQSLALQWLGKKEAPAALGRMVSAGSFAALVAFGLIYIGIDLGDLSMKTVYVIGGGATVVVTLAAWALFPLFPQKTIQNKSLFLRKRYWLYYLLNFMQGARRQIFVVFAGFLMVEKFGFSLAEITLMYMANHVISMVIAPRIGKLIARFGERWALVLEYIGLIGVFTAYAFVQTAWIAVALYITDHVFFAMAIAIKTYFQKIADPADMASTAGVAFTINHVAAVVLPVLYGFLWIISPSLVFLSGAALAGVSLGLALLVPRHPSPEHVARLGGKFAPLPNAAAK